MRCHHPLRAAFVAALVLPMAAMPATVSVTVVGSDGSPAANVVVEIASPNARLRTATEPVVIVQRGVRFMPFVTAVPVGATVRFLNQDGFDHHLRSQPAGPLGTVPPAKDFEFRMPGATSTDVVFDRAGVVVLGCHLHSSMRGHLFVSASSLLGVTDEAGKALIADVPDGRVSVHAWHPEQLLVQSPVAIQLAGATEAVKLTLNFVPPKPRARRH